MRKTQLVWTFAAAILGSLSSAPSTRAQTPTPPNVTPPAQASAMPDCPEVARAMRDLIAQDARLRDWQNLTRYRLSNEEVTRAGASVPVAFLGDSITDAWDDEGR